jgi:hypothetical protein
MKVQKPQQAASNVWAAQINLAIAMKIPELRRIVETIDRLNNPAAKPVLDAVHSRIGELESHRFPDGAVYDPEKDREEYERRERLSGLRG